MALDKKAVEKINKKVYENGAVDRVHLLEFLESIPTNDGKTIVREVRKWLESLHEDQHYSKVRFPEGDILAILSDLDSYGRVQPETIQEFKEQNSKMVNQ